MARRGSTEAGRAVVLAAVVLLAACGSDVDEAADGTTTTIATGATPDSTTERTSTTVETTTTTVEATTTIAEATTTTTATAPTVVELTTTTPAMVPDDEATAVVEAYLAHWPIFDAFLNGNPPGDPAEYFTGARLADLPASVAEFAEKDLEIQGEAIYAPGEVSVNGDEASFTDCQLDLSSAVSRTTGEVVVGPATEPREVAVELRRSDGVWKVSSVVYGDERCVQ